MGGRGGGGWGGRVRCTASRSRGSSSIGMSSPHCFWSSWLGVVDSVAVACLGCAVVCCGVRAGSFFTNDIIIGRWRYLAGNEGAGLRTKRLLLVGAGKQCTVDCEDRNSFH